MEKSIRDIDREYSSENAVRVIRIIDNVKMWQSLIEGNSVTYENGMTAVQALLNGQVDCVIIDKAPAMEYVAANEGLTILEGNWVEEQYAIGFGKGNTALQEAVNKALSELIADGTVQGIIDKYIKAE